ncbi:MAG TPA: hypothetical protein VKS22_03105 [Candidatus Binataceae bacterium]|nr:hypothetical protein [Candidatus Binataceae bacterium]
MFIALGNGSLAKYPPGGGHWSWFLQYPLGLKALGHKILWVELLQSTADPASDAALIRDFFTRLRDYQLDDDSVLVLLPNLDEQRIEEGQFFGKTRNQLEEAIRASDLLWNFCCALRDPLLSRFRRRVLIDVDPGHLQVVTKSYHFDMGISAHDAFLTVGSKINDLDCEIPRLGHTWKPFFPFVYLPLWPAMPDPGPQAPFTSITQWEWEELTLDHRVLSLSKRAAYRKYAALARISGRPFELAANIDTGDYGKDRVFFSENNWKLADPNEVATTPLKYQQYIQRSRAEIQCPKPIFRDLKTGWISDRSICYLASGRPVLAENTGFPDKVPAGAGLVAFNSLEEAITAVAEIDARYDYHSRAGRELVTELFTSARCLPTMIADSEV